MYVKVRRLGSNNKDIIVSISKLNTVKHFKEIIYEKTKVEQEKQRLFYKGKQLEDDYKLFDYQINLNDVIQLMVKSEVKNEISSVLNKEQKISKREEKEDLKHGHRKSCWKSIPASLFFKTRDYVDVKSEMNGAWFEGQILDILASVACDCKESKIDKNREEAEFGKDTNLQKYIVYVVTYDKCPDESVETNVDNIRPKSRTVCDVSTLKPGMKVLVNYNVDDPSSRGFWYDFKITRITKSGKTVFGNILISSSNLNLKTCKVTFIQEIMKIEERTPLKDRSVELEELMKESNIIKKTMECTHCKDDDTELCCICGCYACGGKEDPGKQLVCDECEKSYHLSCLNPPLEDIPEDDWFCPECKTDVSEVIMAGDKLKKSKRQSNLISSNRESKRDWGTGMACVGRTKECTLVPSNHYGPIPGVEVGTTWMFRVQVSEAGVHRPHVAGIHGREFDGAYSIVLSGGYEDDVDYGEEFLYTGAGGRDLSGNKRTAEQSCDQVLARTNKALAMNCNAPVDEKNGAKAKDWKKGKPVRVVRSHKLGAHSKYAPEKGNRYDGIYKVVGYWKEKGKSGFYVWRYRLKRDDEVPAPWTKEGKERKDSLGLKIIYPDGYQEVMAQKEKTPKAKRKFGSPEAIATKKRKVEAYKIPPDLNKLVKKDRNKKLWNECKAVLSEGKVAFLSKVTEVFTCICCCELVFEPVTTKCLHNMCKKCFKRAIAANMTSCPYCRTEFDFKEEPAVNNELSSILLSLYPGYENGR